MSRSGASSRVDRASRVIAAPPARIYRAFVEPEALAGWLPPKGMTARIETFEPRPGGSFRMTLRYDDPSAAGKTSANEDVVEGVFVELVPEERIVWLVQFESDDPRFAGEMRMTWSFAATPAGTEVAIACEDVPEGILPEDHDAGLRASLAHLAARCEGEPGRYIVYGLQGGGSAIVEMALARLGLAYELRAIDFGKDEQRSAEYAAINPQQKIPALITPSNETLTESLAIVLTLDERFPEGRLLPARGTAERARALRWMSFVATELYPVVEIVDYPDRFTPEAGDAAATREVARAMWRRRLLVVEDAIAGDSWLLPSGFSIADAYLATVSRWAQQDAWRREHTPRIEALAAALAERADVGEVWRSHFG